MGKNLSLKGQLTEFNHIQEVNSLIQSGMKNFELRYSATEDSVFSGFYHIDDVEIALLDEQEKEQSTKKLEFHYAIGGAALNKLSKTGLRRVAEKTLEKVTH
tara:strand:- start:1085 stop:1390 length:306 start_codon:yes stop_codon:yes gene_type:complete